MMPENPQILLSTVNMKLRDQFSSFDELCDELDEDKDKLLAILNGAGYKYDSEHNQFK